MITREAERAEFLEDALVDELHTWGGSGPENPLAVFATVVDGLGLRKGRVGLDIPSFYLNAHHYRGIVELLDPAAIEDATNLVHALKLVKSPAELTYIREASRIADISIAAFEQNLRSGRSELELAAEIFHVILSAGAGQPATPMNFASGRRAALSHAAPTERRLERGDFGNLEFAVPYRRYMASIGRQFSIGPPTPRMRALYHLVREASDACISEIRDGASVGAPFEAARRVIAKAGLEAYRVHTVGYSVGAAFPPSTGEPFNLGPSSAELLKAGMVLSICPPIFIPEERLGARVVDNVLVTANGAERLSRASNDLIVAD
jgi:Xaa-Pro dipeptidase